MYYVYILRCEDNSLYTGITNNVSKRFEKHAAGCGAKYTKSHKAKSIEIVFCQDSKSEALSLEYRIKQLSKIKKEKLILKDCNLLKYLEIDEIHIEKSNSI